LALDEATWAADGGTRLSRLRLVFHYDEIAQETHSHQDDVNHPKRSTMFGIWRNEVRRVGCTIPRADSTVVEAMMV